MFIVTSLARCGGYWAPGVDLRDLADDTTTDSDQIRSKKITNHTYCPVICLSEK